MTTFTYHAITQTLSIPFKEEAASITGTPRTFNNLADTLAGRRESPYGLPDFLAVDGSEDGVVLSTRLPMSMWETPEDADGLHLNMTCEQAAQVGRWLRGIMGQLSEMVLEEIKTSGIYSLHIG